MSVKDAIREYYPNETPCINLSDWYKKLRVVLIIDLTLFTSFADSNNFLGRIFRIKFIEGFINKF